LLRLPVMSDVDNSMLTANRCLAVISGGKVHYDTVGFDYDPVGYFCGECRKESEKARLERPV